MEDKTIYQSQAYICQERGEIFFGEKMSLIELVMKTPKYLNQSVASLKGKNE